MSKNPMEPGQFSSQVETDIKFVGGSRDGCEGTMPVGAMRPVLWVPKAGSELEKQYNGVPTAVMYSITEPDGCECYLLKQYPETGKFYYILRGLKL